MELKAILFDLDGTLLPMDQDGFSKGYFKELASVLAPLGMVPEEVIKTVWSGVSAMIHNDGRRTNKEVFIEQFSDTSGKDFRHFQSAAERFYSNEFHRARIFTGENPLAKEAVRLAGQKGRKVVLATNPLFPMDGQATRLSWLGLTPGDFDLVTAYETDRFCKPNPQYFREVCKRIDCRPEECLMIGNDEEEDMYAASSIGIGCYLVTDCLIASEKHPWAGERGTFTELLEKLKRL